MILNRIVRMALFASMALLLGACTNLVLAGSPRYGIVYQNVGDEPVFDFEAYYGGLPKFSMGIDKPEEARKPPLFRVSKVFPKIGGSGDGVAFAFTRFGPPLEIAWTPADGDRQSYSIDVDTLMRQEQVFFGELSIKIKDDRLLLWTIHQKKSFGIVKCDLIFDSHPDRSVEQLPTEFCPGGKLYQST